MKNILLFIVTIISLPGFSQAMKTDTVKQGYYIPFGTSYMSCKVIITPKGQKSQFTNTTGNKIPDSLVAKICKLEIGSVVVYSEVTILIGGVLEKAASVRYVIGTHNTFPNVIRDPSLPDSLSAQELGSLVLDKHVYAFDVSIILDGAYYVYSLTGNGICCDARDKILTLPSGTKVWVENIRRQEDDGSQTKAPTKIYVVK